jgi:hypothetical protein
MKTGLPSTGTTALLDRLSGFVPDDFIHQLLPPHRGNVLFLPASLRYCAHALEWLPDLVVGDRGYISLAAQRDIRQRWGVGVLTRLRPGHEFNPTV